ncbi:MBL fold metallo-hydrolase [Salirhabdus salicampi]|uniref:MBL fold metallo-hydrolase n=1 Tax=Salirhabdus salicampi TaxID=476102 RepID=UPI0020C59430|nr:MBL fold metallo-hydrolase [Salirhabdus salicampi]MCP8615933.1 MBL fold metallo-hydrolase [Salirhabdus salicampi]
MDDFFLIVFFLSIITWFVGLISPRTVLKWGKTKTRKRVSLICGSTLVLSFVMIGITAEIETKTEDVSDKKANDEEVIVEETKDLGEKKDKLADDEHSSDANDNIKEEQETEDQASSTNKEAEPKTEKSHDELSIPPPSGELVVHYMDVGQGDSTLILGPDFTILIDAGRYNASDVVPYLNSVGVQSIDLMIGTHPHADHIGQMDKVLQNFPVKEVWMSGDAHTSRTFERVIDAIAASEASYHEPRAGETFTIGSSQLDVVSPYSINGNFHKGSVAVKVRYGNVNFLFTGDAEHETEREILNRDYDLKAYIYQLGHHGSSTSNTEAFLKAINPEVAIYSAGHGNSYGHPHDEVVNRVRSMGIKLYGTDVHGHILVKTNGTTYTVETKTSGTITTEPSEETSKDTTAEKEEAPEEEEVSANCVDVNTATKERLTEIIHIGDSRADDLISLRSFSSIDQLTRIRGISENRLGDIKEQGLACVK